VSGFGTAEHDLHRIRRTALTKFFSKARISQLEPEIHRLAQTLCDKLLAQAGKKLPFDLTMAYSCFTSDLISDYCFGESFGFLEQESFEPNFRRALYSFLNTTYVFRFFPWIRVTANAAPLYDLIFIGFKNAIYLSVS
jgi:cytochrome P450